jgi:hypothetical protein
MAKATSGRLRMAAIIALSVTSSALVTHVAEAAFSGAGEDAIRHLQIARNEIYQASHVPPGGGGHFADAVRLIDGAIGATQAGLRY